MFAAFGFSAAFTTGQSGGWATSTTWSSGSIAPTSGNSNTINIGSGHDVVLNGSITFGNNCILNVYGNLIINGDLTALNSLVINVTGSLTINGNIIGKNGASIAISGNAFVAGDATFNNSGEIIMNGGVLDIGGSLIGGTGCEITGNGTINIDGTNSFDDTPSSGVSINITLPIELLYFQVFQGNGCINITWSSATELNNDYYTVERSFNGLEWEVIANIKGGGTSNDVRKYRYEDCNKMSGVVYYRLKQVDYNRTFKYFSIKSIVLKESKNIVNIYLNSTKDALFIDMIEMNCDYALIDIYDSMGKRIFEEYIGDVKFNMSYKVDLSKYKSGSYYIVFFSSTCYKNKIIFLK